MHETREFLPGRRILHDLHVCILLRIVCSKVRVTSSYQKSWAVSGMEFTCAVVVSEIDDVTVRGVTRG